jgi:DNA-binding transcriptional MerR regulator
VTSRTYLSIGDVLTLLREEFPDVTISKIRFLESQGLVNPERSPSGYRKFFDHDVERLRWVLRQQREHFLPLKVIRDRLADGDLDDLGPDVPNGKPPEPAYAAAGVTPAPTTAQEQPSKADEEAMARILADASRRASRLPEEVQARRGLQVVVEDDTATSAEAESIRERGATSAPAAGRTDTARAAGTSAAAAVAPGAARGAATKRTGSANGTPLPPRVEPAPAPPPSGPAPDEAKARKSPAHVSTGTGAAAGVSASATSGMATGASLTLQELCAASGLSAEEVAGLESFGLIDCVSEAGIDTYVEEALTVANLAAGFRAFGIEPRHLRLYRNAVEREMGLIEQVVIPLLRQRNPESRQRAVEGAEQLAALGQSMRATLLRLALRRHLGG